MCDLIQKQWNSPKMTKFLILLTLSVLTANGSVIRSDGTLLRIVRSSPPNFHTQQVTGILRSADGSPQGVFSGSTASAQDAQAGAYSVASAASSSADQPIVYPGLTSSDAVKSHQKKDDGNASSPSGLESRFGGGYESSFAYGSQGNGGANAFRPGCGYGSQASAGAQSSAQSGYGNQGYGGNYAPVPPQSGFGSQQAYTNPNQYGYNSQSNSVGQPGGYGSQTYNSGQFSSQPVEQPGYGSQSGGYNSGYEGQGHQSAQSSLHEALGLASQGLQAQQGAGCSTCGTGKSTYAYSNAKAHNGNAIAVSVG